MTPAAFADTPGASRSLVLVTGSGRSGTSLFSGILQRLGCRVPQPEVPADETNPRGFAESQWVVDFHTRLLKAARVQTADARPAAWARTAGLCLDPDVEAVLRSWLREQFALADDLVVKDPRLAWFLPLWRRAARDVAATPRFVTMVRHPAAVVDSKQRHYGGDQVEAGRAAGWVNLMLFTERATRDSPRAFVRYENLLADWTQAVSRAGQALDLAVVRDAPAPAIRRVHEFVDVALDRSRSDWGDLRVPDPLRGQADEVWTLVARLADAPETWQEGIGERLDTIRAAYADFYAEAESVAFSSIVAERGDGTAPVSVPGKIPVGVLRLIRRIPLPVRRALPAPWRARIARRLIRR